MEALYSDGAEGYVLARLPKCYMPFLIVGCSFAVRCLLKLKLVYQLTIHYMLAVVPFCCMMRLRVLPNSTVVFFMDH